MGILENLNSNKLSRKSFIFYSGLALMSMYALVKIPFKFLGKKKTERVVSIDTDKIIFKANPNSIKRS